MQLSKYYILFLITLNGLAFGQISFEAIPNTEKTRIGEDIAINFVITLKERAELGNIEYPSFAGFKVMRRNRTHQLRITNGDKTIQNIETVVLRPEKKGKIRIGKAKVRINGALYESSPLWISVTEMRETPTENTNEQLFLVAELSENTIYINQPIYATIKLYAKSYDALNKRSDLEIPDLSNFRIKPIETQGNFRDIQQEMHNNQVYISEVIGRYALIPQKSGNLNLPAFYVRVAVPIDFFDERIIELNTPVQEIRVKNLPPNPPHSFNGAIGNFTLNAKLPKNYTLEKGRPFNLNIEITGEGNLSYIQMPKLDINKDLELYNPRKSEVINDDDFIEKGKIMESYTIVPQYGGEYKIPPIIFSYFNPEKGRYITTTTEEIPLNIKGKKKMIEDSVKSHHDSVASKSALADTATYDQNNTQKPTSLRRITQKIEQQGEKIIKKEILTKQMLYSLSLGIILILTIVGFYLLLRKRKKSEAHLTPKAIPGKKQIEQQWKALKKNKTIEKAEQYKGIENCLQNIVAYLSEEEGKKTILRAREILTANKGQAYAQLWEKAYTNLQALQYAPSGNEELLEEMVEQLIQKL